jgi:hypothetical protein
VAPPRAAELSASTYEPSTRTSLAPPRISISYRFAAASNASEVNRRSPARRSKRSPSRRRWDTPPSTRTDTGDRGGREALTASPDWGLILPRIAGLAVLTLLTTAWATRTFRAYQKAI